MRKWTIAAAGLLLAGAVSLGAGQPASAEGNASYSLNAMYSQANPVPVAKPVWTFDLGVPPTDQISSRVSASGDAIVAMKANGMTGISLKTGKTLWTHAGKFQLLSQAVNGFVYAATADGKVVKLNAATGKQAWTVALANKQAPAELLVDKDLVFATDGAMTAIEAATGKVKWTNKEITTNGTPRVYGDLILQPSWESGAYTAAVEYAVDRKTGKTLWNVGNDTFLGTRGGMFYYKNTWPFGDDGYALKIDIVDPSTGKAVESRSFLPLDPGQDSLARSPRMVAMDGDDLYIQATDGAISKYNLDAGGTQASPWIVYLNSADLWIAGPYDGRLFFESPSASYTGVEAIKLIDGTIVSSEGVNNPISRMDLIDSGMFVAQTDGQIYAIDLATGKARFRYQTASRDFGPFRTAGGELLVQAKDKLYAFKLPAELMKPAARGSLASALIKSDAKVTVNGKALALSSGVMTTGNRMFVPLQELAEALGAKVANDAQTKRTTVTYGTRSFSVGDGSPYAVADGKQSTLTYPSASLNGSLYVPVKDFGDLLGVQVNWNAGTRTVEISTQAGK